MDSTEQAAILLLGMGEEQAAQVLKHMDAKQVEIVVKKMTQLSDVQPDQIDLALQNFASSAQENTSLGVNSNSYIRNTLVNALGSEKAATIIDRTLDEDGGIEVLKWQDAAAITSLIRDEHPQVIAVILVHLDSEKSAEVLQLLPDELRIEVMPRIATLQPIAPQALYELNLVIEENSKKVRSFKNLPMGGARSAANILNFMDSELEQQLLEEITKVDEKVTEKVHEYMFPFDNLVDLDKRSLQTLLREVASDVLTLALKGADEELQNMFFSNMSERAADMLKDDLEAKGPVQLSKVETAQKDIVATAQRLAKEGTIVISGGSGEEMVE